MPSLFTNTHIEVSEAKPIMILPQVHLRKPCYDFYFLYMTKFDHLLIDKVYFQTPLSQSGELTKPFNR